MFHPKAFTKKHRTNATTKLFRRPTLHRIKGVPTDSVDELPSKEKRQRPKAYLRYNELYKFLQAHVGESWETIRRKLCKTIPNKYRQKALTVVITNTQMRDGKIGYFPKKFAHSCFEQKREPDNFVFLTDNPQEELTFFVHPTTGKLQRNPKTKREKHSPRFTVHFDKNNPSIAYENIEGIWYQWEVGTEEDLNNAQLRYGSSLLRYLLEEPLVNFIPDLRKPHETGLKTNILLKNKKTLSHEKLKALGLKNQVAA